MKKVVEQMNKGIFLMDGAMGTQIQGADIPAAAWRDTEGCNEVLNLTAPDLIGDIHIRYLEAGSDAVETNTFGGSPITLDEYGLSDEAFQINRSAARIAREAADHVSIPDLPRFVFGSIGPGTRLPTLGQVSFDDLRDALKVQISGLLEGGVDGIIIETCQDLLQIKAALAAFDNVAGRDTDIAVYVSVTVEQTGTLLIGSNIGAVVAALSPYPVDILGMNCATGPEAMRIHLDYLAENWPRMLACMPNAGMPIMRPGGVEYPLKPEEYAALLGDMAKEVGLHVVGGCCGTSPDHIARLRARLQGYCVPERNVVFPQQLASVFSPVDMSQEPRPLFVGERANATGSKKFRETLLADDYEKAFTILTDQEEKGAHVLDLSCAYAGRDEKRDIEILVERAARESRLPLMLDSTQLEVMEAGLTRYGGRMIINSVNFEAGEAHAEQVADLARRFGAALVCLTIDEEGMAKTAVRKVEVARRLVAFCEACGLQRTDLFIDALTFTIGSGDETMRTAGLETLEAIRQIKRELPGVRTILGVSNISFGLKPASRKVLNAVFMHAALEAGLDAAIVNVAALLPLNQMPDEAVQVARALLNNDHSSGDPLEQFIHFFEDTTLETLDASDQQRTPEEMLNDCVIRGKTAPLDACIPFLLETYAAEDILNELLVPAMKEVGRLFNDGILQLPFVLKSAEVMKQAVAMIKPYMKSDQRAAGRAKLVLATVSGDVHDIGKNLVDIILSNNGFEVINLGTKVPVEQMMAAIREHKADVLGMSGLLVKSAAIMAENIKALAGSDIQVPVLLGGAALTPDFVADTCQPLYSLPVVYCRDAFEGLTRMREYADHGMLETTYRRGSRSSDPQPEAPPEVVDRDIPPPQCPFFGWRTVTDINLHDVYPLLNEIALIRGRWGYRRGKLSREAYDEILSQEVYPRLERLKIDCVRNGIFRPAVAYGYFHCRAEGEKLVVYPEENDERTISLTFPRQARSPYLAIPDYFRADEDVVGFMVVTLGPHVQRESSDQMDKAAYRDYYLLHGFAVEVTDALAEFWHGVIRREWGFEDGALSMQDYITQQYRGSRYGFGYPACPDLSMNRICCDLVHADRIGVSVSENDMMIPEVTTSALVAHHPQARYFYIA